MNPNDGLNVKDAYERVSDKLYETAAELLDFEAFILRIIPPSDRSLDVVTSQKVQNLDRVHQTLLDLSLLIRLLNDEKLSLTELADHLNLEATKALLGSGSAASDTGPSGAVDLF